MSETSFSALVLAWFDHFGRKNLPWQHPRTAYRVWVSEIMLQQTQVKTVIPYFNRFMEKFPDIRVLANAVDDEVLALWSGLGYYSRALNLIKTAGIICEKYQGEFPADVNLLAQLPGIGLSTAAAITSQAYNLPTAILDANVKRVLSRYFAVEGFPEQSKVKEQLWQLAQSCMPLNRCADYTQAIMDLGANCCNARAPSCHVCPIEASCLARRDGRMLDFPQKKIKKIRPVKQQQFLLLQNPEGLIFLEKKPLQGLWAGLWCLPAIDIYDNARELIEEKYALHYLKSEPLMSLKHSFSHFHLEIKVLAVEVLIRNDRVRESNGKWFELSDIFDLGLAKPTSVILKEYRESKNSGGF